MATRIKRAKDDLYETDFYVWTEQQAALLRARRLEELDLENLIEEIEALGRAEKSKVLNNARVIIEHLLKLQSSRAPEPRNKWRATVRERRRRLESDRTPRLWQILAGDLELQYAKARDDAAASLRDHGEDAAANTLPQDCPYTLDDIIGDWLP
jgi:hypothetical protein